MTRDTILVTGAAGFIGSHLLVSLADAGYRCIPLDNLSVGNAEAVERARLLTKGDRISEIAHVDIRDRASVAALLSSTPIAGVIHLAGSKSVADSVSDPLAYYNNNVAGTLTLLEELRRVGARQFVFSSSATVYSSAGNPPFVEDSPVGPVNPYGRTKLVIEQMLDDLVSSDPSWRIAKLRYFNPVGAHPSGTIGEDPRGAPANLMPYVCDVAAGRLEALRIFGKDYPTIDGTGIRDYIHVMDLAEGHIAALNALRSSPAGTALTINLGSGHGTSVKELLLTFERVNAIQVPHEYVERRLGDVAISYADCSLAKSRLGWAAKRSLDEMCRDAWRWKKQNPRGYSSCASEMRGT